MQHQDVVVLAHLSNGEILRGYPTIAHVTGHFASLEDAAWPLTTADGTTVAEVFVGAVGGAEAAEVMTLHDALETLALAAALYVHQIAHFKAEVFEGDLGAELVFTQGGLADAQLADVAAGLVGAAGGLKSARLGLVDLIFAAFAKADYQGIVGIGATVFPVCLACACRAPYRGRVAKR